MSETPEPPQPDDTQRRLRRLNLTVILPPLAIVGAVVVFFESQTWLDAVVIGIGAVAGLVAFVAWTGGGILRIALPCLAVTTAVWVYGVLTLGGGSAFYGLLVVGPLVVSRLPRSRGPAAAALIVLVGAIGATRLLVTTEEPLVTVLSCVVVPIALTTVVTLFQFPNKRFYDVVTDLEQARDREAELAVARERIRFASDLHDIQGHTLHVVKLKTVLARKLVRTDPDRAEQELQEVNDLVADTITQTKELVYAQRRLNLTVELENAKNLFEAAGIRVRVEREAEVDESAGELLGQVLRETTTNILRHAQAEHVWITLARLGLTIVNDGARDAQPARLSGLAALRERLSTAGGELTVEQRDGRFVTSAELRRGRPAATIASGEERA